MKSLSIFVIIATPSSSVTLSVKRFGIIVKLIWAAVAWGLSTSKKVAHEINMPSKLGKKKQYEKDPQKIKSVDKLWRKILEDNLIDESECDSLCIIFTKYVNETKNESFFVSRANKLPCEHEWKEHKKQKKINNKKMSVKLTVREQQPRT